MLNVNISKLFSFSHVFRQIVHDVPLEFLNAAAKINESCLYLNNSSSIGQSAFPFPICTHLFHSHQTFACTPTEKWSILLLNTNHHWWDKPILWAYSLTFPVFQVVELFFFFGAWTYHATRPSSVLIKELKAFVNTYSVWDAVNNWSFTSLKYLLIKLHWPASLSLPFLVL